MKKKVLSILIIASMFFTIHAQTVKIAYDLDPLSLDPHEKLGSTILQMSHIVFDPLIRWTQDLKFEPRLAKKFERINETTMRFYLRKNVKFHSGNAFSAKDVKWTFERLKESADFKGLFTQFIDVKIIDDYTIDFITDGPYPLILNQATYIFPMDSKFYSGKDEQGRDKRAIVKHADTFASKNASGTGPFKVTEREQGVKIIFDRFVNYWDKNSKGNVQKIIFTPIKEDQTRISALLSGDIDFIAPVAPADHNRVRSIKNLKLVTLPGTVIFAFQMNQKRRKEFKNIKVRQAIVHAINNEVIVKKIMRGFATTAGQMSPKGYLGHNPALKPRFDLAKAKRLMKEAGYEKGFKVSMMSINTLNRDKVAQAVVAMLKRINIDVSLKILPSTQYWPKFDERAADIMISGWHADTEDSANFYEFLAMTPDKETGKGQYNSGNYSNAEVDKLTIQTLTMTDPDKRAIVLQKIEKIMYDEAAFIPLFWKNRAWASIKKLNIEEVVNSMDYPYLGDLVRQ